MNHFSMLSKQRGFSSACFFIGLVFFSLMGYIGIKLVPSYVDFRNVSNAVNEVSRMQNIQQMRRAKILSRISESVHRNTGFSAPNLKLEDVIYVASRDGQKVVGVSYEVAVKLFFNVSALLEFEHEKVINPYK